MRELRLKDSGCRPGREVAPAPTLGYPHEAGTAGHVSVMAPIGSAVIGLFVGESPVEHFEGFAVRRLALMLRRAMD